MPKFMLLFHESPDLFKGLSPEEIQGIVQQFTTWRRRLEAEGRFVAGDKLQGDGRVLRRAGSRVTVTNGPFSEAREVHGGYFAIQADDYDHAVELSRAFPLERGTVEIRQTEYDSIPRT